MNENKLKYNFLCFSTTIGLHAQNELD